MLPKVPGPPLLSTEGIDEEWVGGETTTLNQKEPNDTPIVTPGFGVLKNELQKTYTGELNRVIKTAVTESAFTGGGQGSALANGTEGMTLSRFGHKIRFISSLPRKLFKQLLTPSTVSPLGFGTIESKLTPGDKFKASMEVTKLNTQMTSGVLVVGQNYTITAYVAGDDFTNVGAASNATNISFFATGTTPTTWSHSSEITFFETLYTDDGVDKEAWGGNTAKVEALVHPSNPPPTGAFKVLEASQEQIDSFTALQSQKYLVDAAFPILTETKYDHFSRSIITITKQIVPPGSVTSSVVGGVLTEQQPLDKYRIVKIVSSVQDGTPATVTYPATVSVNIPPWFTSNPAIATAVSGALEDIGLGFAMQRKDGKFQGTMTRSFYTSMPPFPSDHPLLQFTIDNEDDTYPYFNTGDFQYAVVRVLRIPENIGSSLPSGTYIFEVQVQPWLFGYFSMEELLVALA